MSDIAVTSYTKFMTVTEAAELLRLAPKTLYSMASAGRIPYRKVGRRLLFLEAELIESTRPVKPKWRL